MALAMAPEWVPGDAWHKGTGTGQLRIPPMAMGVRKLRAEAAIEKQNLYYVL